MKLISLYIENFGGLSRFELDFDENLTVINQPNGFGKTTLAEFIRAMFYGFPRKVKTLEKSRRQKYAPWNGGQYGGNLVFEQQGRQYRIERTFGATPKGDTFNLIDLSTNRHSTRYSEEIGIELFGLDSDSFERSTYLPQLAQEGPLATASIQAKLAGLVEDSSDVRSFGKTMAALRAKRSALIPYRGSGGAVAETAGQISRLQLQLDAALLQQLQLAAAQEETAQTEAELERAQSALEQRRQELTAASEMAAAAAQQRQYAALRERHRQLSAQTILNRQRFPMGFPAPQELAAAEESADRLAILEAQNAAARIDPQVLELESFRFNKRIPPQSELEECRRKCGEYELLQTKIQNTRLAAAELTRQEREQPDRKAEKYRGMLTAAMILLLAGVLAAAGGSALLYLQSLPYGGIGLALGAAFLTAGTALLWNRGKKCRAAQQEQLRRRQELDVRMEDFRRELAELTLAGEQCSAGIREFLGEFGIEMPPQHYLAGLTELEHHVMRFKQLKTQQHQQQIRMEQQSAELENHRMALQEFFGRCGLHLQQDVRAQLRRLREDIRDAQTAEDEKHRLETQLAAMEQEWGDILMAELSAAADPQWLRAQEQQLRQKVTSLTARLLHRRRQVQELQEKIGEIPALRHELAGLQQKKAEDQDNVRILDDTMEFLMQAKENLSTSYLGTIRSRFGVYLAELEGMAGERCFIDTDFQVQLERSGQARELAYFSAGQTDLVMLCMRLALVDALFQGQETCVILDDPFVNLDDAHMAQALGLLRRLSSQRQILYLTCHTSRTL